MSIILRRNGILFVISAPSGGGKSTVLQAILKDFDDLGYSISATSRAPRGAEQHGIDYYFLALEEFKRMIERSELFEWAQVHGNYYGTPRKPVEALLEQGKDVIMDIDVQGAHSIKAQCPDAVTIFLLPPSMETLENRLRGRHTDGEEAVRLRLKNAAREIAECRSFDYIMVNDDLGQVLSDIRSIIAAERARGSRQRFIVKAEPAIEELLT